MNILPIWLILNTGMATQKILRDIRYEHRAAVALKQNPTLPMSLY